MKPDADSMPLETTIPLYGDCMTSAGATLVACSPGS